MSTMSRALLVTLLTGLAACAGKPQPDWQMNAHDAMERSVHAWLVGDTRTEAQEFDKARSELARTGRVDLLARAELKRCAARVASLVFEPCEDFEKLRADAARAERAYADYLRGSVSPQDIELLPQAQRAAAAPAVAADGGAAALRAIDDPLSRLVAAGVLFQAGRASPQAIALAVDAASQQGWRRPLAAWLLVQARLAEQAGDGEEAARLRRRIEVVMQDGK